MRWGRNHGRWNKAGREWARWSGDYAAHAFDVDGAIRQCPDGEFSGTVAVSTTPGIECGDTWHGKTAFATTKGAQGNNGYVSATIL